MHVIIQQDLLDRSRAVFETSGLTMHGFALSDIDGMLACQRDTGAKAFIIGANQYPEHFFESIAPGSLIMRYGVGYNAVPVARCKERGVFVAYTPGTLDASVAEHTMGLIMDCARHIAHKHAEMKQNVWAGVSGIELEGKTLAVIGFGNIGKRLAKIAKHGFGMRITAYGRKPALSAEDASLTDVYTTDFKTAVDDAAVVALTMGVTDTNKGFIDASKLALMRNDAIFVNTARGVLVNEGDLYDALAAHRIACAGIDVFTTEPYVPVGGNDLRTLDNVVLTPHVGSNTDAANRRMAEACVRSVVAFGEGRMGGVVMVPEQRG
ncbi:MAG: hypothetical protein HZC28_02755 [Spirochaetes bacterium]|nr:hypothetical protein [Spirochaetota bacterium]